MSVFWYVDIYAVDLDNSGVFPDAVGAASYLKKNNIIHGVQIP